MLDGHDPSIRVELGELVMKPGASCVGTRDPRELVRGLHSTIAILMLGESVRRCQASANIDTL